MASSSGQNPWTQEGVISDSSSTCNKTKLHDSQSSQSFEGPLQLDAADDDEQILVDHDHNQLMRRRSSQEAKKENVSNGSNSRKLNTDFTGVKNNGSARNSSPKVSSNQTNYSVPDKSNTNSPQSKPSHPSVETMIGPSRPQTLLSNDFLPSINSTSSNLDSRTPLTPTRSFTDLPNQVGNIMRPDNEAGIERELHENGQTPLYLRQQQWENNYKEAAIFLEEGMNNDKFSHHPRSKDALPAYLLVHNTWFHLLDLAASLIVLMLGLFEKPAIEAIQMPEQVHATIELCALLLIAVLMGLRTRWVGWQTFVRHKRTSIKIATLTVMIIEAIVVIARADSHFRITRSLRPIFLIDNHYCGGVRRFVRQILQSLSPIIDMLVLVFFVMLIYSVFGFYLFGDIDSNNFSDLLRSFISLFVLLTTANYPDVMMASYDYSKFSAIFFISYLSINLYFLMNLMLAVVYDAFTTIEKEKFRRLYLHKRKAAQHAFGLLVTKERPDQVSFQHFEGLIKQHKPSASQTEAYLMFKQLNKSGTGYLYIEQFYGVYDVCVYNWNVSKIEDVWYSKMNEPLKQILSFINKVVTSSWFENTIYLIVLANGIILIVQTSVISSTDKADTATEIYAPWVSYFFVGLYTLEASMKLLGLGFSKYFSSYWNLFDFIVTVLGILSIILAFLKIPLFYIIILRPLRLLTLFRMKKRFRDVFGTAVILFPRLTSAVIVLILTYYFFAIIGMESFRDCCSEQKLIDCCVNTSVEEFYKYENHSNSNSYYYLNNFDNMPMAGVTLFELTVVNNWFITMEGHAIVSQSDWSRLFFMTFYIFTMIVMTIIVAFILEAFLFRIQYKSFLTKDDEIKKFSTEIFLSGEEIQNMIMHSHATEDTSTDISAIQLGSSYRFVGYKTRTKEQLQLLMYHEEIDQWLAEANRDEARNEALLQAAILKEKQRQEAEMRTEENSFSGGYRRRSGRQSNADQVVQGGVIVQVVDDEDEVTTIHREVLPDLPPPQNPSSSNVC